MFKLEFDTNNDFFQCPRVAFPVEAILQEVSIQFFRHENRGMSGIEASGIIFDPNGNNIGTWEYKE